MVWNSGAIKRCEIEDGLAGDQVGAVRGIWLADGTYVSEKLVSHSDLKRSYQYDFQSTPFEVEDYLSTLRITPVTDGDRAFAGMVRDILMRSSGRGRTHRPVREYRLPERVDGYESPSRGPTVVTAGGTERH